MVTKRVRYDEGGQDSRLLHRTWFHCHPGEPFSESQCGFAPSHANVRRTAVYESLRRSLLETVEQSLLPSGSSRRQF